MRSGCRSAYITHPSIATTLQGTQEVQREFWRSLKIAGLKIFQIRPAVYA